MLGCNELDFATPSDASLDAQNGHVHAITNLGDRYHVHICPTNFPLHPRVYTPEIQYYSTCNVQ